MTEKQIEWDKIARAASDKAYEEAFNSEEAKKIGLGIHSSYINSRLFRDHVISMSYINHEVYMHRRAYAIDYASLKWREVMRDLRKEDEEKNGKIDCSILW
jgi:hypothetical protein